MNLLTLAIANLRYQTRSYLMYFLSSVSFISIFFLFDMYVEHPQNPFHQMVVGDYGPLFLFSFTSYIVIIFAILFLFSSMSLFLQFRKQEFSLYHVFGATRGQINWMIISENIILGLLSILVGIGIGILFSKLFLIITSLLADLPIPAFYFPTNTILRTSLIFSGGFLINCLLTLIFVRYNRTLTLLSRFSQPISSNKWMTIFGLIVSIFLIWLSMHDYSTMTILLPGYIINGLMIIMSLFLLLHYCGNGFLLLITKFKKNPTFFLLRNQNQLQLSKRATLAISILIISLISISFSMSYQLSLPSTSQLFTYRTDNIISDKPAHVNKVGKIIEKQLSKHNIQYKKIDFSFLSLGYQVIRYSDYQKLSQTIGLQPTSPLAENEAILITKELNKKGQMIRLPQSNTKYRIHQVIHRKIYDNIVVVSNDQFDKLLHFKKTNKIDRSIGYYVANWMNQPPGYLELKVAKEIEQETKTDWDVINRGREAGISLTIVPYLVVIMLLLFATNSFLYFHLYARLMNELDQWRKMYALGLSMSEVQQIISSQLFYWTFIPNILGTLLLCSLFSSLLSIQMIIFSICFIGLIQLICYLMGKRLFTHTLRSYLSFE
ncbi:FtsX-like permease family protein [Seinonella peptonophila]|uniref:FtsX-like permease family protein n=1 Tax=Seinonella peptonophila TaxID=112248 RepID=A0A1M4ZTN5_9BACL|nr:ABC transporter permease [Seinonella peptonophila]SHF21142.1 FtsX-like permease family protein [Seinonella peptonophila]